MPSVPVTSFWSSIEVECVASDFPYEDYVILHTESQCQGALLCRKAYELVGKTFDTQFAYDQAEIEDARRD